MTKCTDKDIAIIKKWNDAMIQNTETDVIFECHEILCQNELCKLRERN